MSLSSFMGNPNINCPRELPSAPKSWPVTCVRVAAIGAAMSEDVGPAESRPNRPRQVGAAEGHFPACTEAVHPCQISYGAPAHEDTRSVVIDAANNPRVTSGERPLAQNCRIRCAPTNGEIRVLPDVRVVPYAAREHVYSA